MSIGFKKPIIAVQLRGVLLVNRYGCSLFCLRKNISEHGKFIYGWVSTVLEDFVLDVA